MATKLIEIVPYDAGWAAEFRRVGTPVRAALGERALRLDLVRVPACQTVRTMDVEEVEGPHGSLVAQLLQSRPDQGRAAPALIKKPLELCEVTPIGCNLHSAEVHFGWPGVHHVERDAAGHWFLVTPRPGTTPQP